jgi:hypothetical protein
VRFVAALMLMVFVLLGGVCVIYAQRVARLVPFAKDYGVTAHVRYMTGLIPFPITYIDVGHRDCPDWIRQEYRHHRGVSVAAAAFSFAALGVAILVAKIAGQL